MNIEDLTVSHIICFELYNIIVILAFGERDPKSNFLYIKAYFIRFLSILSSLHMYIFKGFVTFGDFIYHIFNIFRNILGEPKVRFAPGSPLNPMVFFTLAMQKLSTSILVMPRHTMVLLFLGRYLFLFACL